MGVVGPGHGMSPARLKLYQKVFYIALLFDHRILKCLMAIELKTVGLEPEFVVKMNFCLALADE